MIKIRSVDGKVLYTAELASAVSAAVEEAVAATANLGYANLRYADLGYANLRSADLRYADLRYANLGSANLGYATGLDPRRVNDLLILLDQPGKVRAYKLVTADGVGPTYGGITYMVGETYAVEDANTDPAVQCAKGINLGTLPWCFANWQQGYRILLVEFSAKDVAAIPVGNGKFRVSRCKVVKELDLAELGLVEKAGVPS